MALYFQNHGNLQIFQKFCHAFCQTKSGLRAKVYQSGGSHEIFLKAQVSCYAWIIFCDKKQLKMAIFDPFHQLPVKKIPL